MIAIGIILIVSGLFIYPRTRVNPKIPDASRLDSAVDIAIADGVLTRNERDTLRKIATETEQDPDKVIADAEQKLASLNIKAEAEVIDQNMKSGYDFEKFIVKKFNPEYFKIKNWAGDKFVDGRYAETTPQPDLLMEYSKNGKKQIFAIECKWRKNKQNDGFEFAKEAQMERYRKFEKEKNIPVFVAIGMGGEGNNPEHLYIIPLKRLKYNFITLNYLEKFERNKNNEFSINSEMGILE